MTIRIKSSYSLSLKNKTKQNKSTVATSTAITDVKEPANGVLEQPWGLIACRQEV